MPANARSVVKLCAEQKLVPELPIRQLSRTLSGVAPQVDADPAKPVIAAKAIAILRI
jgi:hypothetical protein